MLQVSEAMAKYLCNCGNVVYRLFEDGSEAQIQDESEINEHAGSGGIFGIEN